jgi:hypothetical protein
MNFNNPKYNYVEAEVLLNKVKDKLTSYFDQGTLDDSYLYPSLKSCLDRLGYKVFPLHSTTVTLTDKMGDLPKDFYKLVYSVGCANFEFWDNPGDGWEGVLPTYTQKAVVSIPVCKSQYDYCKDECGNLYEFTQEFDMYKVKYSSLFSVTVTENSQNCESSCFGGNSANTITIIGNRIFANFSGNLYIEYLSNLETEEGLLVPDYTQITDWIEAEMIVNCLEKLYLNGEGDVLQRLQYTKNSAMEKYHLARAFVKSNEVKDFYDVRNVLSARMKKHTNAVMPYANRSYK